MMKPRNLLLPVVLCAALIGPGTAMAVDDPSTSTTIPTTTDPTATDPTATDPSTTAPITLDQEAIDALNDQAGVTDDSDKSVFEKASDFVTDNAPWFIIGIIVLAAIIAGILIMRGRPRKSKTAGTPRASKSNKSMRNAGGLPADETGKQPAQVPSASELRRRKRAAIQRSREEERLRRKAGIEGRRATRQGEVPVAPVAAAGVAASGGIDPVEAEKQGAKDQEIAAGAMARFDPVQAPVTAPQVPAVEPLSGRTVPAPVSPSQTAPAAGVVTPFDEPDTAFQEESIPEPYAAEAMPEADYPEATYEPEPSQEPEPAFEPEVPAVDPEVAPLEAPTSVIHEPSVENPGADAATGNAAQEFLAAGAAAGAVGGFAAARASQPGEPAEEPDPLEPVLAPEPGMAAEHALADPDPVVPVPEPPVADAAAAATADERLRAKVAEIKATQEPAPSRPAEPEPVAEPLPKPGPLGPDAELSPGLAAVERKLSENSEERDRALRDAEDRLRRVEQRAEDAERRAAFAERLAQLKVEESEREKRLNDVVSGIDRAEQRAREAEARAESAERAAAAALEKSDLKPSVIEPRPVETAPESSAEPEPEPQTPEPQERAVEATPPELPASERKGLFGRSPSAAAPGGDAVNLNSATFEELREAGLSVTQATRILAYRERFGGYDSVEDLEKVPGFPADLIESLQNRITI